MWSLRFRFELRKKISQPDASITYACIHLSDRTPVYENFDGFTRTSRVSDVPSIQIEKCL